VNLLRPWLIRFVGVTGLTLLTLFIFFNYIGKIDVDWALPWTKPFRLAWPSLPHYASWSITTSEGKKETLYQVPTRILTKKEIAQLRYTPGATGTNATPTTSPSGR
jgi:hypothetical protein